MVKTIGDACNIRTGKLDANRAVKDGDYPFFTCAEFPEKIDHYAFDGDVVLIAGNNARGNFHVSRYQGKFNAYQRTYVLTAKPGYDIDYIYYALKLELKRLREKAQGSQTKFLTMPILTSISLRDFVESEQSTVSKILKILDKKIALNNRINAELETMAKTLYDYWFVQFDFPDANGKPYKTSGGKMEYNATLKREIPAGWSVTNIGSITKTVLGGTPSTENDDYWKNANIPWLSSAETASFPVVSSEQMITSSGIENSSATLLSKGTVVISIVRYIRPSILGIDAATNQSVVGIRENDIYKSSFIYSYFCSEVPRLMSLRTGAQQPHINKGVIDESPIALPPSSTLVEYYKLANPVFDKIMAIAFQNHELVRLRDWLLPLLMNGQVTVK
ncbi:TPA: restriction endonuclease subunit S [Escherichia coli]|uniref:restriction endonuclease subunit S n=1 Tax=Enterobacteriaceae TaxID=543 RepID=UPI000A266D12|nr:MULTISPECIES: restriction endonuclease subunit S [Enterobacteriaceae]HBZ7935744.1 restriction endonuclease subunit S [Klebsiella variicola subsp. variicola]HDT1335187.1 restriction endonuclease subunit S [Klebsiella pneumoniae subsp. ozaenae]EFH9460650.1 restriction endonuclease subunit S [Escherichia coli]EFO5010810.1 restriction endonuclease subunit S [Escherichia coli]EIE9988444.1 restriction endonuclease subunit S [Escherichia coli]